MESSVATWTKSILTVTILTTNINCCFYNYILLFLCVIMQPAGLTIDNKTYFTSVEKLIENYKRQSLPNRRITLMRGFSITEERLWEKCYGFLRGCWLFSWLLSYHRIKQILYLYLLNWHKKQALIGFCLECTIIYLITSLV